MQRGTMKQKMGLVHARVQHFLFFISRHTFISLRAAEAFSGALVSSAGPLGAPQVPFTGTDVPQRYKLQISPTVTIELLTVCYDAGHESQAVNSKVDYKPGLDMVSGRNTDKKVMHV